MKKANSHLQSEVKILPERSNSRFDFAIVSILSKSKRSQSQIIATILLILITISAAAIIGTFATGFVKDKLEETNCFDVANQLEISNNLQYTCYDQINNNMFIQIHLLDADIEGFVIEIGGASTTTYTIKEGTAIPQIGMYGQAKNSPLELPGKNEEKTYNITSEKPEIIAVYPVIEDGKICDESDSITNPIDCYL